VVTILQKAMWLKSEFGRVQCIDLLKRIPTKFISYFSKWYCIFYTFLKFIQISRIINENENEKLGAQCWAALWPMASGLRPGPTVQTPWGLAGSQSMAAVAAEAPRMGGEHA
jgi:hypothetical protein